MSKLKAKWQKTDIPEPMKIELWRIIRDCHTQKAREEAIAHKEFPKEYDYWVRMSRDTLRSLFQQLVEMPEEEVDRLPQDLQTWVKGLEDRKKIKILRDDVDEHWNNLSNTAEYLSDQLRSISRYIPEPDEIIGDVAVNYNKPEFLEFISDPWAIRLLSHMKAELPELKNLRKWADLKVKDITQELLDKLSLRADRRDFKGKCDVCGVSSKDKQ